MASPNLSELVTSTLRNRSGKDADNVTKNNALLTRLKTKGKVKPFDGGRTLVQELQYAENSTFQYYSGYDTINVSPSDVLTGAEFNITQAVAAVTMSGLEDLQNSGKEQILDLLETRIENGIRTLQNNLAVGVYSDGTGYGGRQIGGLQLLVADTPTSGTVGGIARASWPFWRNISFDATTDGGSAATSSNIQSYMNRVWLQLVRGADKPDIIVADNNYFRLYWESLQSIQRITKDGGDMAAAGFTSLQYMNADVVFDGGYGGAAPANHMYFLNTDYVFFRPHRRRNFVPIGGAREAINQDASVRLVGWAGQMTLSNAFLQGVLKD
jgi:hypothetical protein